jgi:cytochrome c oxidase subunit II
LSAASDRRKLLKLIAACTALPVAGLTAIKVHSAAPEVRAVKLVAQRFHFTPLEITLKPGEAVQLEITSLDFIHGLSIPDLKLRADLPPGRITKLRVQFDKAGAYDFLCDNFCGSEHEEMSGKFIVKT